MYGIHSDALVNGFDECTKMAGASLYACDRVVDGEGYFVNCGGAQAKLFVLSLWFGSIK